jgi:hypothetical protein
MSKDGTEMMDIRAAEMPQLRAPWFQSGALSRITPL